MKKKLKNLSKKNLFILLWTISICSFAQKITIMGLVTDTEGEILIGATIQIQGTSKGTITDIEGKYSIQSVPIDAKLEVSYVGMQTQVINVNGRSFIHILLKSKAEILEEIVVIGYGQQKKISVTGSISTVTNKELQKTTSTRLDNALAGRITGLTSMQVGGGQPGVDGATLFLRGAATVNGKNPLILIDGVERDNIGSIDMNEVESVSVLKDASSTAVFGVRGANGVILITTRRGEKGKPKLSIKLDQSWTSFTKEPERIHSWEFMEMRNQAKVNSGLEKEFSEEIINKYRNPLEGLDPSSPDYETEKKKRLYMYCDNDFYRMYIARNTPQLRMNANISGKTDIISYFLNVGYIDQGGNLNTESPDVLGYDPSSWMRRLSLRSNLDFQLAKSLKVSLNMASYAEKVNMPSSTLYGGDTNWMMSDLIYQSLTIKPLSPGPTTISEFGIEDGHLIDYLYLDRSAFEVMNRKGFNRQDKKNLNSQLTIDWDLSSLITPGLSAKVMAAYDTYNWGLLEGYKKEIAFTTNIDYNTDELYYEQSNSEVIELSLSKSKSSNYRANFQGSMNYNRIFGGKHAVTGMVLAQRDYWETTGGEIPYNVLGISARLTYAFDDKYLAEINAGYNGSEQFAPKKRFGFFPAFSVGYILSNEPFLMDNNTITWLKFRCSWGKVGNDKMGSYRFLFQNDITVGGGTSAGGLGGRTINEGLLGNENITWELAKKLNVGIEIGLFSNLRLSFDFFKENRDQILLSRQTIPAIQGVLFGSIPKENIGIVENHGFEVELTYNKNFNRDLSINVKGNFGFNKNTIIEKDEPHRPEDYKYRYREEGFSIGQCWGYKIDWDTEGGGFFLSQNEIDNHAKYESGTPRIGDFIYVDQNGDGVIDDKDMVPIGYSSSIPGIVYGLSLGIHYKHFDFNTLFSGLGRYSMYYTGQGVFETTKEGSYYDWHKNAFTLERWQNGDKITYPALSVGESTSHRANDFFIQNRSFLRLKNIEIGYTLPKKILQSMGISNVRIYASGQNLLVWDVLRMGYLDPEQNNPYGYPITKNVNLGLSINF